MYGPKIDFLAKDSLGRTFQIATIQLDFNQPRNFELVCTNEKGEKETVVMIHAAIMGSIERFTAALLEHTGGNLPFWLAPLQVAIITVSETHAEYARVIERALRDRDIRTFPNFESESLGKKIREVKMQKIPCTIVIGDQEVSKQAVTLESRDKGKLGEFTLEQLLTYFADEAAAKR